MIICILCHVCDVTIKYYYCSTVKHHKMAVHSHYCTIISLDIWSMAMLQYGQHLYGIVYCIAITIYGMVESPSLKSALTALNMVYIFGLL